MKYLILFFLLSTISLTNCENRKTIQEAENNNNFLKANPIIENCYINGTIETEQDQDFFLLDLRKNSNKKQILQIQLSKVKGLDLKIDFYKGRKLVKTIDDYKINRGESIKNLAVEQGIYYISVSPSPTNKTYIKEHWKVHKSQLFPSESYHLSVQCHNYIYQELEPNDYYTEATNLELDQEIFGNFAPYLKKESKDQLKSPPFGDNDLARLSQYEFDWYSFSVPVNGIHNITLILDPVENVDSIIGVYHKKRLVIRNSKGLGSGERVSNLRIKGNEIYYIVVIGVPHDFNTTNESNSTYRLALNIDYNKSLITESESNDSFEKANLIEENQIHGYLSPKDDKDYYELTLNQDESIISNLSEEEFKEESSWENLDHFSNEVEILPKKENCIEIELTAVENIDSKIQVFSHQGNLIKSYDSNPEGEGEIIHGLNINKLKKLFILVSGGKNNKNENFKTLYTLLTKIKPINPEYELEPNDAVANIIPINKTVKGYISAFNRSDVPIIRKKSEYMEDSSLPFPLAVDQKEHTTTVSQKYYSGDIDYFKVQLKPENNYQLTFQGVEGLELELKLIDHNGVTIKQMTVNNTKKHHYDFKTVSLLEADYLEILNFNIEIKSLQADKSNSKIPYQLLVQKK